MAWNQLKNPYKDTGKLRSNWNAHKQRAAPTKTYTLLKAHSFLGVFDQCWSLTAVCSAPPWQGGLYDMIRWDRERWQCTGALRSSPRDKGKLERQGGAGSPLEAMSKNKAMGRELVQCDWREQGGGQERGIHESLSLEMSVLCAHVSPWPFPP